MKQNENSDQIDEENATDYVLIIIDSFAWIITNQP